MDDLDDPSEIIITKRNPDGSTTTTKVNPQTQPENRRFSPRTPNVPFPNGYPSGLTPQQERRIREAWKERQRELREKKELERNPEPPRTPQ